MEKAKLVKSYKVRLYCDDCGKEMEHVQPLVVLDSFPVQYMYYCTNPDCPARGKHVYSYNDYPYMKYEEI